MKSTQLSYTFLVSKKKLLVHYYILCFIAEHDDKTNYTDAPNGSITKPVVGDKTLDELLSPKIEPGEEEEIDDTPRTAAEWDKSKCYHSIHTNIVTSFHKGNNYRQPHKHA